MELCHNNLIWSEAHVVLVLLCVAALIGICYWRMLFFAVCIGFALTFYFFRNPERICTEALNDASFLICPADGKVVDVKFARDGIDLDGYAQRVSIFLSPFDVHVNWIPFAGCIEEVDHTPGTFTLAFLPKSSLFNEHNDIVIYGRGGKRIKVRQIAGMVARRICCWVHKGQLVKAGDKFGLIRFGSRVDVFLPENVQLMIGTGQRVYGGQTPLGKWLT